MKTMDPHREQRANVASGHASADASAGHDPELRRRVRAVLAELARHQQRGGFDSAPAWQLHERLAGECCRLAVLGEFKRGKSTLLNALLDVPGLLPVGVLPCTSALIEIVHASGDASYAYRETWADAPLLPSERDAFLQAAGAAHRRPSADAADTPMRCWRITQPSPWLERLGMAVIDTPGLNEDPGRTQLAIGEALRADAALLILSLDQPFSRTECELLPALAGQAENLFVVANRADLVAESEWPDVRTHLLERLHASIPDFDAERLLFISAKHAGTPESAAAGECWPALFEALRTALDRHLARRAAAILRDRLDRDVSNLCETGRKETNGDIERHLQRRVMQIGKWQAEGASAEREYSACVTLLSKHFERARWAFGRSLVAALPGIFEEAWQREGETWTSEEWITTSPKAHVTEVARKAQAALEHGIDEWLKTEGSRQIADAITTAFATAARDHADFFRYIDSDGEAGQARLIADAVNKAFGRRLGDHDLPVGEIFLAMGLAAIIGYIISDIVLFYIAGVVTGFVNPVILAGAVVVGLAGYAILRTDLIADQVRTNVYEKIRKKLEDGNITYPIMTRAADAVQDIFTPLLAAFRTQTEVRMEEHRLQLAAALAELRQIATASGIELDLRNPHAAEQHLTQRLRDKAAVRSALDRLEAAAAPVAVPEAAAAQ